MIALPARAIVRRELLSGLRNPRPFYFLTFFMLVMILGFIYLLRTLLADYQAYGMTINTRTIGGVFTYFGMGLYCSAAILIPPMAGISICIEKQQDTYDLLRMTYIRPSSLALAKLTNVLSIFFLVVIASLPIVGVFFFLVGIDWSQFIISFALVLFSALSLGTIGLLCSTWFYRTLPAIITTYIIGAIFHGGWIFLLVVFDELISSDLWLIRTVQDMDLNLAASLVPFVGIGMASEGQLLNTTVAYAAIYHLTIVAVCFMLSLLILRRPAEPMHVDTEKPIDSQAELKARRKQFPYYLLDPRRRRPHIPDIQNPVYAKELQTGLLARGSYSVRVFYCFSIVSFMVALLNANLSTGAALMIAWPLFIDTILVLIVTPTLVATALAKEWEWQNIDSLRTTLLSPIEITEGKYRSALRTAMLPVAGSLLGCMPLIAFGYDSLEFWRVAVMATVAMVVCVLYTLAISFCCAIHCRRSLTALMSAYGSCGIALLGIPLLVTALEVLITGDTRVTDSEILFCFFFSPIMAYLSLMEVNVPLTWPQIYAYFLFNAFCFVVATKLLLTFAGNRFARSLRTEHH